MRTELETQMIVELDKEKRKGCRRRLNRRLKPNPYVSESCRDVSKSGFNLDSCCWTLLRRPAESPATQENEQSSALQPAESRIPFSLSSSTVDPRYLQGDGASESIFARHWPLDYTTIAIQNGNAYRGLFRVNPHNRVEAYCQIEGVPVDILVSGYAEQNRAVEGDIVAIQVDPLSRWTKMKGSNPSMNQLCAEKTEEGDPNDFEQHETNRENTLDLEDDWAEHDHNAVEESIGTRSVKRLCSLVNSLPNKRPTGRVVAILEKSRRRDTIVGFLSLRKLCRAKEYEAKIEEYVYLIPTNPKLPKMTVLLSDLPDETRAKIEAGDLSCETELVAAVVHEWDCSSHFPQAVVTRVLGRGSDFEAQMNAILFEDSVNCSEFSAELLPSLPDSNWEVPPEELERRRDLRSSCVFTIDPPSATDLDDALSFEKLSKNNVRIGVHIADASYFVVAGTALDAEAQARSSSVYLTRSKIPMLPSILSENLGSLKPGVDRLAFSIFWDINEEGAILDRWIGRTVIRSCCKMSYEHAHDILNDTSRGNSPDLCGDFQWAEVRECVKGIYEMSKILRNRRFEDEEALFLDLPKLSFHLDENGIPFDFFQAAKMDSGVIVEEMMLLANKTAAEIISSCFPDAAFLRRHPEPSKRKLKELEAFCGKLGFDIDASSSGSLRKSLTLISEKLRDDRALFEVMLNAASKCMQVAAYFCSGNEKDCAGDWRHYALAAPVYTHFTSPLRRYPDIVVHRTLAAILDAEAMMESSGSWKKAGRCFSAFPIDKEAAESSRGRMFLSDAAAKHGVPSAELMSEICAHSNERKQAAKHVKSSFDKLFLWMVLRRKKIVVAEAKVVSLGPRFMSVYIPKIAIERRIYYEDVEGLTAEWLENTSTLILSFSKQSRSPSGVRHRSISDVALIADCAEMEDEDGLAESARNDVVPATVPVTVRGFSSIPVAIHAVGGDEGPPDFGVRLLLETYLDVNRAPEDALLRLSLA